MRCDRQCMREELQERMIDVKCEDEKGMHNQNESEGQNEVYAKRMGCTKG